MKLLFRWIPVTLFVIAGVLHCVRTGIFADVVPPYLTEPDLLACIFGVFEFTGGVGLAIPKPKKVASWGKILLLVAVFPVILHIALEPSDFADSGILLWHCICDYHCSAY